MYSREFLSVTNHSGVMPAPQILGIPRSNRTHVPISVSISAGTATVKISGRNSGDDEWVELTSVSASDAPLVQWMPQIKAELTASTGGTVRVTAPESAVVVT